MSLSRSLREEWLKAPRSLEKDSSLRRLGVGFLAFLVIWAVLYANLLPDRVSLEVGEAAPEDVSVPRETTNRIETERLRAEAAAAVPDVYHEDARALEEVLAEIRGAFEELGDLLADGELDEESRLEALKERWEGDLEPGVLEGLAALSLEDLREGRSGTESIVASLMQSGVKAESLESYQKQLEIEALEFPVTDALRTFCTFVGKNALKPNLIYSASETEARKLLAIEQVQPVKLARGEVIVRKGQKVTAEHMALLEDLGLIQSGPDISDLLGAGLMAALIVGSVGVYLGCFNSDVYRSESRLVLLMLVFVAVLLMAQVFQPISGFLAPVAALTMLVATLIEARLAIFCGMMLSATVCIIQGWDMTYFVVGAVGGLAGVYGVSRVGQRSDFMRAGFVVSTASILAITSMVLMMGNSLADLAPWRGLLWGALNGVVSAIITMGSLPYLEIMFHVITPMKLIELSNPNRPLLKRLLMEAPGTYHHSVMVANLAEAATEAVGGDSLLARVGSYYHDVGKVKRPYFFIDNQFGQENPHDRLSPSLSTLIITSHVKDGLEMAEEHKVPEPVKEFIRTHHGTSLVSFFYNRAAEDRDEGPAESDFRYEGPKPSTRETAIVMLADGVEAAVRSLTKPTPGRIEGIVKRIIKERLNDGQLDKCDLTFQDLDIIADTFARVLSGMFHPRVEYPENVLKEMERRNTNGGSVPKQPGEAVPG